MSEIDIPFITGGAIQATHLAQVFTVRIKHINDSVNKCGINGNIIVRDEQGDLVIYKDGFVRVDEGFTLSLASVDRPIFASSDWSIILDLKDDNGSEFIKNSHHITLFGPKVSRDDMKKKLFDKSVVVDLEGKMGVATIFFCVPKFATLTRITNKLHFYDGRDNAKVFGTMYGFYGKRYDHGDDDVAKYCRIVLFDKKYDERVLMDKDSEYLLQSCVTVPSYSSLILEVDIHCVYPDGTRDQIRSRQEFSPLLDLVNLTLNGVHGEISLEVYFPCNALHARHDG